MSSDTSKEATAAGDDRLYRDTREEICRKAGPDLELQSEIDDRFQGQRGVNLPVSRRHGIIDPINIQGSQFNAPVAGIAVECAPHQHIFHLHGHTKNSHRFSRLKPIEFMGKSARMKSQAAFAAGLALNHRDNDGKTVFGDEG